MSHALARFQIPPRRLVFVFASLAAFAAPSLIQANPTASSVGCSTIYWTSLFGPTVRRAAADGSQLEILVQTGGGVGLAVDAQNRKMYWVDDNSYEIRRSNLDGTAMEVIVPRGVTINPVGIDLDVQGGKIYWTDEFTPIRRANLDGSNIEDLLAVNMSPRGIALDVSAGKMYWQELFSGKIRRANLDGSNPEDLLDAGFGAILDIGLALDLLNGKIYWTDLGNDTISRANLDGSQIEHIVTSLPDDAFNPTGVAIDAEGGKVYWNASGPLPDRNWRIQRANLDGSNAASIFVSPLYDEVAFDIVCVPELTLVVPIDIKPGAVSNSINPRSRGVIPVAVITTDTFDAATINSLSLTFGPGEAQVTERSGHLVDVDGDGDLDLLVHFRTQESGIRCGDTEAVLKGTTIDGRSFTGSDSVRLLCPQ